jgi:hypothetical protein
MQSRSEDEICRFSGLQLQLHCAMNASIVMAADEDFALGTYQCTEGEEEPGLR